MADSSLEIKIKALVEGADRVGTLTQNLGAATRAALGLGDSSRSAGKSLAEMYMGSDSVGASAAGLAKGLNPAIAAGSQLTGIVKTLTISLIGLAGALTLKSAADAAATNETLGVTLQVVGRNAGYTKEQLAEYEEGVKALGITSSAARKSLTQLIQAGIDLSAVNEKGQTTAVALARASQNLAVVTGENSSQTLERLITNIRQMDTVGLRYMGLTVNIAAAQEKFAGAIGKTADSLTQTQKQQAVMNGAMVEAEKLAGAYEEALGTVGKQLGSLARYAETANVAIGNNLLPAYQELVAYSAQFMKNVTVAADGLNENSNFGQRLADGMGAASSGISDVLESLITASAEMAPEFANLSAAVGDVVKELSKAVAYVIDLVGQSRIIDGIFTTVGLVVAGLADGLKLIGAGLSLSFSGLLELVSIGLEGAAQIAGVVSKETAAELRSMKGFIDETAKASRGAYDGVISDIESGNSSTQKFLNSISGVKVKLEEISEVSSFSDVQEQVRGLTEGLRTNGLTSTEAAAAAAELRAKVAELGATGKLTEAQVTTANSLISSSMLKVKDEYDKALLDMGLSRKKFGEQPYDEEFLVKANKKLEEFAGNLGLMADNAEVTKQAFSQAFETGLGDAKTLTDVESLSRSLEAAKERLGDVGEASAAAGRKVAELFDAQLGAAKTETEVRLIEAALQSLQKQGVITQSALTSMYDKTQVKMNELAVAASRTDLVGPLKDLGLELDLIGTGLSNTGKKAGLAFADIVEGLIRTGNEAGLTQKQITEAFSGGLKASKTIGDLEQFITSLKEAKEASAVTGKTYSDSMAAAKVKFDELFQSQLKLATTKTLQDELSASVVAFGEQWGLTGTQVTGYLDQVAEKATQAKVAATELAKNQADEAEKLTAISKAGLEVDKAKNELAKEERTLTTLITSLKGNNTKEAKAQLDYQKAVVAEAKAEIAVAKAKFAQEVAGLDYTLAKQKQITAERKLQLDPSNEGLEAEVKRAEKNTQQKEIALEKTRQTTAEQERLATATAKSVEKAREYAAAMGVSVGEVKKAADDAEKASGKSSSSFVGISIAAENFASVLEKLKNGGLETAQAVKEAKNIIGSDTVSAFGYSGIIQYQKIQAAIKETIEKEQEAQAEATKLSAKYAAVSTKADLIATGMVNATQATKLLTTEGGAAAKAMNAIKVQAIQAAAAAKDAASSFIANAGSLQADLLEAQGKDDQAAVARYNQKKAELDIEYQLLRVKLQSAIASAKVAGVDSSGLQNTLGEVDASYQSQKNSLAELFNIEQTRRTEAKAKADEEAAAAKKKFEAEKAGITESDDLKAASQERELKAEKELADSYAKRIDEPTGPRQASIQDQVDRALQGFTGAARGASASNVDSDRLQSIAKTGGDQTTKVVEHKFTDDAGNEVTAKVPERQSDAFIKLLSEMRRRAQ